MGDAYLLTSTYTLRGAWLCMVQVEYRKFLRGVTSASAIDVLWFVGRVIVAQWLVFFFSYEWRNIMGFVSGYLVKFLTWNFLTVCRNCLPTALRRIRVWQSRPGLAAFCESIIALVSRLTYRRLVFEGGWEDSGPARPFILVGVTDKNFNRKDGNDLRESLPVTLLDAQSSRCRAGCNNLIFYQPQHRTCNFTQLLKLAHDNCMGWKDLTMLTVRYVCLCKPFIFRSARS